MRPETLAIAAGRTEPTPDGPLNLPIMPASALHPGGDSGYTRDGHAPWEAFEGAIGALEGGHAVAFASGMGAAAAAMRLFPANPVIVAPEVAYMAVREELQRMHDAGTAQVRWVDIADTDAVLAACEGADVLWIESPTNPLLAVADMPRLCAHARSHGLLSVVDNTVATPLLQRPLALGADVVVHSATKAIGGHSDLLLGVAVVRDEGHLEQVRHSRVLTGATPGALEVFLALRGLRTLPLRLERAQRNAAELARRLSAHPEVHEVRYPGLPSHPDHERAAAMGGPGFMLTFRVRGGAARADAMLERLELLVHTTSLGAVETTLERRAKYAGESRVPEDLLRVSVGCEAIEDLWSDLDGALTATATGNGAGARVRPESAMRAAMWTQPEQLARLLGEPGPAEAAAARLKGRRLLLVGIGTSWHAAHHGAWMLRAAGVEAEPVHAADVAPYGRAISPGDGVVVLSHTGSTGYSMEMLARAREAGAETLHISGIGNGGELETVAAEASYAYTASHTGAMARLAQLATALGADLGPLRDVPERVAAVLELPGPLIGVPGRLVELIGAGPNGWTAQEGALKIREAAYVAAEGLSCEQFFHGPSVALDEQDTLVVLDGGGPMAERTEAVAAAVEVTGAAVARFPQRELGEALSVFPLTVVVQRIALELAEARGVSPDRFRYEEDPRREAAFEALGF